jgi:DMSO/TMAO reductase YedYZ molybdopterin-dependent catalytic subunit
MSGPDKFQQESVRTPEREIAGRSRRGFLTMAVAAAAGLGAWKWLNTHPEQESLAWPLRRMLRFNERAAGALYDPSHLSPGFPPSRIQPDRVNGDIGLGDDFKLDKWTLSVESLTGASPKRQITLSEIKALPKVEHTTELKCIEGWSVVVHWTGARFSDFTEIYSQGSKRARYAALQTPDKEYYVGLDMASLLHPQTLLCYAMNGAPLTMEHGAPVRLVIPVKYGIKNIKRIGSILYTDRRPNDYWAERSYDWYAGL